MNRFFSILLMVFVCSGIMAAPSDGNGRLGGKVTDKRSGEPLVGVTIYFPSLSAGTVTDVDGRYTIGNLECGNGRSTRETNTSYQPISFST